MDSPINLGPQTGWHRIFAPLSTVPSYSTSFFWLVLSIPLFHKSYPSCFPYSAVVTNIAFSLNLNRQTLKQSSNSQLTHGVRRALVCCPELTHAHSPAIKVQCVLTNQRLVSKIILHRKHPTVSGFLEQTEWGRPWHCRSFCFSVVRVWGDGVNNNAASHGYAIKCMIVCMRGQPGSSWSNKW